MIEDEEIEEVALCELRQKAKEYYAPGGDADGVIQKIETVLNSMFYDRPTDTFGHLAKYFEAFAKTPVISKLRACQVFDSRTVPTIQTQVCCDIKGQQKTLSSFIASTAAVTETVKPEEKDAFDAELLRSIEAAVSLVEGEISDVLVGLEPTGQEKVDMHLIELFTRLQTELVEKLEAEKAAAELPREQAPSSPDTPSKSKGKGAQQTGKTGKGGSKAATVVVIPDEPPEPLPLGREAAAALSQAICKAGALLQDRQLYEHITLQCAGIDKLPEYFHLPLPMVTIMLCGRGTQAKLKCVKEFMVVPSPAMPVADALNYIEKIYNHCFRSLSGVPTGAKGAPPPGNQSAKTSKRSSAFRMTSDTGALCPQFERPEQGLDLLQEAIISNGLTPGVDFHLAINCAAHEIMDFEKGKYEISTGTQKSAEELIKYWQDILTRYTSVIALIDPMRKQDAEQWMQLSETVSPKCYVVGDFVYHRPGRLRQEELSANFQTSGIVLYLQQLTTVTDVLECAHKMKAAGNQIIIGCGAGETTDSFAVDLAIGCGARFIKIGGPCRGERVCKLNRLLELESFLRQQGQLAVNRDHVFTAVHIPPPPPPDPATDGEPLSPSTHTTEKRSPRKQK